MSKWDRGTPSCFWNISHEVWGKNWLYVGYNPIRKSGKHIQLYGWSPLKCPKIWCRCWSPRSGKDWNIGFLFSKSWRKVSFCEGQDMIISIASLDAGFEWTEMGNHHQKLEAAVISWDIRMENLRTHGVWFGRSVSIYFCFVQWEKNAQSALELMSARSHQLPSFGSSMLWWRLGVP